ncbi:hypothetical protein Prum_021650 [Phytohabitans rumicis]|uniref:Uncharacterized protein n=1 Tax=Phytohabitans rumicis TaxID=1076125 RepID=A0A6V8KTU6_9ACTN|nr:hypothetical protein Prum_021650 [Phytohabitans rumicis]
MAREIRYGRTDSPIIHAVPIRLPRSTRTGWLRTNHHMYRIGPWYPDSQDPDEGASAA